MASPADWSKPSGYQTMIPTTGSVGLPDSHGQSYFGYTVTSRRDAGGGYSALLTGFSGNDLWFTYNQSNTANPTWKKILHNGNFNSYAPTLTGVSASGTWDISITGNAATAANLSSAAGNISSTSSGTVYTSAVQVREVNRGGVQGSNMAYAPRLAFHWGGLVANSLAIEPSGRLGVFNNPGTAYEDFIAQNITATGTLTATNLSGTNTGDQNLSSMVTLTGTQTLTNKTFTAPVIGTPASGNLSNCTSDGTNAIGYRHIPQNIQSIAYTLVLTDAAKHILHPTADTTARIFTIPANASLSFPIGTAVTFVNQSGAGIMTIAITTDVMRLAGAGTTGSRALAANGIATAVKLTATEWIISGTGLT